MSIEPDAGNWSAAETPVYLCFDAEDVYAARRVAGYPVTNADLDHYAGRENVPLDSEAAAIIHAHLNAQIEACRVFICLIGPLTAENPWVSWEIEMAKALSRRPGFVGALLEDRHERPAPLRDAGAVWVPFNRDHLERAVRWACASEVRSDDFEFRDMAW